MRILVLCILSFSVLVQAGVYKVYKKGEEDTLSKRQVITGPPSYCPTYYCLPIGDNCGFSDVHNNTLICQSGQYCSGFKKCKLQMTSGPCDFASGDPNHGCGDPNNPFSSAGAQYSCATGNCTAVLAAALDNCVFSSDCLDGMNCVCPVVGMNCTTNKICSGFPAGDTCTTDASCAFGLYCDFISGIGVCVPEIPAGQNCTVNGVPCTLGNVCGHTGVCVPIFSVPLNGSCSGPNANLECAQNTYCGVTGVCELIPSSPVSNCTLCSLYGVPCGCDLMGNHVCTFENVTCRQYLQELTNCEIAAQCKDSLGPLSCINRNCSVQYNQYIACLNALTPPCIVANPDAAGYIIGVLALAILIVAGILTGVSQLSERLFFQL